MRDNGFEVFDAYADMELFFNLELFEVQTIYSD